MIYIIIIEILHAIQLLIVIIAIIIGYKNIKILNELRIILLLPILSLAQDIFSEFLPLLRIEKHPSTLVSVSTIVTMSVDLYIISEFSIIIYFLRSITTQKNEKNLITFLFIISIFTLLITSCFSPSDFFLNNKYFLIIEGICIEYLLLKSIFSLLAKSDLFTELLNPTFIICLGFFLSFLILWPTSIITILIKLNFYKFSPYIAVANSTAYLIFFISIAIAFSWKK